MFGIHFVMQKQRAGVERRSEIRGRRWLKRDRTGSGQFRQIDAASALDGLRHRLLLGLRWRAEEGGLIVLAA
jgi:hypothetical protein